MKSIEYKGVTISETFTSKHGSGRKCDTRQGWVYMGSEWSPSAKQARARIDHLIANYSDLSKHGKLLVDRYTKTTD